MAYVIKHNVLIDMFWCVKAMKIAKSSPILIHERWNYEHCVWWPDLLAWKPRTVVPLINIAANTKSLPTKGKTKCPYLFHITRFHDPYTWLELHEHSDIRTSHICKCSGTAKYAISHIIAKDKTDKWHFTALRLGANGRPDKRTVWMMIH